MPNRENTEIIPADSVKHLYKCLYENNPSMAQEYKDEFNTGNMTDGNYGIKVDETIKEKSDTLPAFLEKYFKQGTKFETLSILDVTADNIKNTSFEKLEEKGVKLPVFLEKFLNVTNHVDLPSVNDIKDKKFKVEIKNVPIPSPKQNRKNKEFE